MRLAKYKRDVDAVQKEGENLRAVWSPDTKLIAVIVSGDDHLLSFVIIIRACIITSSILVE